MRALEEEQKYSMSNMIQIFGLMDYALRDPQWQILASVASPASLCFLSISRVYPSATG